MSGTEPSSPRPAPEFGQYASPEEQARRRGEVNPEIAGSLAAPTPIPAAGEPLSKGVPKSADQAARFSIDRIVTYVLLGYGLVNVVFTVPQLLNIPLLMNDAITALADQYNTSVDAYTPKTLDTVMSYSLITLWAVLWAIAAFWSTSRLRAAKTSFWIPLAAGIIANVALFVAVLALLINDPAFGQLLESVSETATPVVSAQWVE